MKKFIAIFLAVVLVFCLLTSSVFATGEFYGEYAGTYFPAYLNGGYDFTAVGLIYYAPMYNVVTVGAIVTNYNNSVLSARIRVQCAIEYSDGTYDFDYDTRTFSIDYGIDNEYSGSFDMIPNSDKTIIAFNTEYNIGSPNMEELWLAGEYIVYPGING